VVEAAQEQLERFSHIDFTIVPYEVYVSLAERLCELAPIASANEDLCARAAALGDQMRERMTSWLERYPQVGDVRGLGAMLAIELVTDAEAQTPAPELASEVTDEAAKRGLLLLKSGIYSNCIRVLTPLTLSDAELDEALGVWEDALGTVLPA
jgi:4-aminobutyrate aminotransferase / (S)-3-amino-2-methylpropionate transaminase / 5-aminovalerate transaminase